MIYYESGITLKEGGCAFNQHSVQNISFALFYSIFVTSVFSILSAITVSSPTSLFLVILSANLSLEFAEGVPSGDSGLF